MARDDPTNDDETRKKDDRIGLAALGVLVVFLGLIVYWALPKKGDRSESEGTDPVGAVATADASSTTRATTPASGGATLERLAEASSELGILTDKPEAEVQKVASPESIAKILDVKYCGGACDAVKKALGDRERFEVEIQKAEDYILPPKDSWPTVAGTLTPSERATIGEKRTIVVLRVHGPSTVDQIPARAAFATAAAVADALSGFVYDETTRRIQTARDFATEAITVPIGQNGFSPKHIVIQLYRQDDGTARLLTLGMIRFGSPDFTLRGAPMEQGSLLAGFVNAVASQAAFASTSLPITVTRDAIARVTGAPSPGSASPGGGGALLEASDAERTEGDPENEMLELSVRATAPANERDRDARAMWSEAVAAVYGSGSSVVFAAMDKELETIADRARRDLPAAEKRWKAGEASLYLKGPFPIPAEARQDGGPLEEWMWIQATSCDARGCDGVLSNAPGYATNLTAGSAARVERAKLADWILRAPDGGTTGGASIGVLEKRR